MKELRYYLADPCETEIDLITCSDELFMDVAEKQGDVYTQQGFKDAFNNAEINTNTQFLRIIEL